MPAFHPITEVTPLASMVTGFAVSSGLGDQIRDDLVALYDGWWFRASKSTTTSMSGAVVTPFELDTITLSATATAEGSIALSNGDVLLRKTGPWMVGGHWTNSAAVGGIMSISITHTDWPVNVCNTTNDSGSGIAGLSCSGVVEQSSATGTLQLVFYSTNTTGAQVSVASQILWGVWMGERP